MEKTVKRKLVNTKKVEITRTEIENTPFEVWSDGKIYVPTLGGIAVTNKKFKSKEDAEAEMLSNPDWNIIINVMCVIAKKIYDNENTIKKDAEKQN